MTLFKRRLIFIFFLLLFIVIAPALILFANGYRLDWKNGTLYKTGLLVVEYTPKDAHLVMDDVTQGTRSPERVNGLSPRSYNVRIEKDGYLSWEKRLWIPEYVTTFVRHVVLFRQSTPQITAGTYILPTPHPTRPLIAAGNKTPLGITIALISPTETEILQSLGPLTTLEQLSWSANGERLLVVGKQDERRIASVFLLSDTKTAIVLDHLTSLPLTTITWDRENDDVLAGYGRENNSPWLFLINIRDGSVERSLISDTTMNRPFVVMNKRVILLTSPEKKGGVSDTFGTTVLFRPFTPQTNAVEYRIQIPSMNGGIRIAADQTNLLTLMDDHGHTVFFVEREPRSMQPIVETFSNVTNVQWSPNGRRLVYWNSSEVFLWDLERNTKERIYRVSDDTIEKIFWHTQNEYVFIQTKKTIQALEIDGRDQRNLATIVSSLEEIPASGIDPEGQWIWVQSGEGIKWYEIK